MRLLACLAVLLLAGPALAADGPVVRIALAHKSELLGSEKKGIAELEKQLAARKSGAVRVGDASPAEVAAVLSAVRAPAPPEEWRGVDVVVVIQISPPSGKAPKRISGGIGRIAVFRPPSTEPVYIERFGAPGTKDDDPGGSPFSLGSEDLGKWLATAIAIARGAQP